MIKSRFLSHIRGWYRRRKRRFDFPWRRTRDPYRILVSEIMLQQTQISRVLPKYHQWLKEFPTLQHLVFSPFFRVLQMWRGLGYNRRARYLKDAAEAIMRKYGGVIPRESGALKKLPGIGSYTAGAIACFAYGRCEPFLDTNIRRVYLYFFRADSGAKAGEKELVELVRRYSPKRPSRDWYYALMDYGREALGKKQGNPNRLWCGYAKQSKFIGSRRAARAKIVALLLDQGAAGVYELKKRLEADRTIRSHLAAKPLRAILVSLEQDGLIRRRGARWTIAKT